MKIPMYCEKCGSTNMKIIRDPFSALDGLWWQCVNCGWIGDEVE